MKLPIRRLPSRPAPVRKAWILAAALILGSATLPGTVDAAPPYAGRPLAEALRDLQAQGLDVFFASHLVRPEMRVLEEPTATEPRAVLAQLLAPHRLAAVAGPGGRLVVVAATPEASAIRGLVRDRGSGEPIPGVRLLISGTEEEVWSGEDGTFRIPEVAPGVRTLDAHLPGFVVEHLELTVAPGRTVEVVVTLEPAPLALDEIVVTPSRVSLLRDEPVTGLALDRDDIFSLPHLGDDVFRALTLLPGVTGEEVSARFNVRGGRADEVLVLLDRVELFEPYHLKDYSSSLSIVAPRALREVNLITGGFPAQYGGRMSGVLDMSTVEPERRRTLLGLGVLIAEASGSGTFSDDRGHWLGSLRRGQLDLALDFLGTREQPQYWDGFAKVEHELRPGRKLGLHLLHSDDRLDFQNVDPDTGEDYDTSYESSYLWLTHQAILGDRLFVDTVASLGRVERDRRGREDELEPGEEGKGFTLVDRRRLDVASLKQEWNLELPESVAGGHYLKWGFELRELDTRYDYLSTRELDDPLEDVRSEPRTGTTEFDRRLRGDQVSAYLSDRLRLAPSLAVELGLRYDRQDLTDDRHLSPRVNVVWALGGAATGRRSTLRLAWGYFYQSQRPYELQVEDGITELVAAERTEQRVVGYERPFSVGGTGGWLLRVEAYQREISNPRARYENLFEPISIFPEIEPDRVLFAPESAEAYGLELFLRGTLGERVDWWVSYTASRVEDHVDGRDVPRRFDQPHAFNLDVNYRAGEHWNVNLAWRYHAGWPTTAFSGRVEEDDEGELEVVPVLGPLQAERLPDYHRLDLRANREWRLKKGVLGFYLEIQNLYDRENVAGFDVDLELEESPDGEIRVVALEEVWGGFLPSFGVTWEF